MNQGEPLALAEIQKLIPSKLLVRCFCFQLVVISRQVLVSMEGSLRTSRSVWSFCAQLEFPDPVS